MVKTSIEASEEITCPSQENLKTVIKLLIKSLNSSNLSDFIRLLIKFQRTNRVSKIVRDTYSILLISLTVYDLSSQKDYFNIKSISQALLSKVFELHCTGKEVSKDSIILNQTKFVLSMTAEFIKSNSIFESHNMGIVLCDHLIQMINKVHFTVTLTSLLKIIEKENNISVFSLFINKSFPYLPSIQEIYKTIAIQLEGSLCYLSGNKLEIRPFARSFISMLSKKFEIVVLTFLPEVLANDILSCIDDEHLVRYRIFWQSLGFTKNTCCRDIRCLGRDLDKTIIIDSKETYLECNPLNVVKVKNWEGQKNDKELLDVLEPLLDLTSKSFHTHEIVSKINGKINGA